MVTYPLRDGDYSDIAVGDVLNFQIWISAMVRYSYYFNYSCVLGHFQHDA